MAKQTKRKQGGKGRPFDRDGGVQAARRAPGAQRGPDAVAPLRQLVGLKSTDQPATTPDPDPYLDPLDGYKPAEWHIPRAVASRFGLPVRFPALWPDEPLGTSLSNLRPAELWEALFATLWRLAKQKDQKWTKRMEHEMDYRLFKAGKNLGGLVEDLLALKRVPTGRPPGSGGIARLGNSLPLLRQFLLFEIGKGRTRERGYTPTTMTNLEYWWEEWRDIKDFPVRDFPKAQIQRQLDDKKSPSAIADMLLGEAFGVSLESVRAHLKKALRHIPPRIKAMLGLSSRPRKAR